MSDRTFKILSWFIGIVFCVVLFVIVCFLGFSFFDCDFSFFTYGLEQLYYMTGGC